VVVAVTDVGLVVVAEEAVGDAAVELAVVAAVLLPVLPVPVLPVDPVAEPCDPEQALRPAAASTSTAVRVLARGYRALRRGLRMPMER